MNMQKEPLISIILVNFNGKQFLEWCLISLSKMKTSGSTYEVIVVDNNSWDDSVQYVRTHFPKTRIIESSKNLGFAGGNNLGVSHAKGKYVVLLNNDTTVDSDWLQQFIKSIKHAGSDVAAINGKTLLYFPFIELTIDSDTCPKIDVVANGDFRPVGVLVERETLAEKSLQHLLHHHSGFYEEEIKDQIGSLTNGHAKLLVPFHPEASTVSISLMIRTLRMNSGEKTKGSISIGDEVLQEFVLEAHDVLRCNVQISKKQLQRNRFFVVQNAGNAVFRNGFVRDIGSAVNKDMQIYERDSEYFQQPREVPSFCGVNVLIRKDVFQKLQGFDESFFMYYEDADLALRMRRMGYKIMYEPKAVAHHVHSGTSGPLSSFIYYHAERNHLAFIWKQFPFIVAIIQSLLYLVSWLISSLRMMKCGAQGGWGGYELWEEKASYRWRVLVWMFMNIPRLLVARWKISQKEKCSLSTVFQKLY